MKLNNESKTLFIPLYGKALMSKNNLFIKDAKAEEIISKVDFNFSKLKQSKWLSMYMSVRARIIDEICIKHIDKNPNTIVVHLGCGLDSRCLRVSKDSIKWYDIDFDSVINLRRNFYDENKGYKMIGKSVTDLSWLDDIENNDKSILIVAEGLTMYLSEEELRQIVNGINAKFDNVTIVFDAYSKIAVKSSKIKNPVNQMDASIKWGMNKPSDFTLLNENIEFVREYLIRDKESSLKGITKFIFENLYCGKISESLYKIYEFRLNSKK